MAGLSVHAVDVARGAPAQGMRIEVFTLGPERRLIAEGRAGANGALDHAIVRERLAAGAYEAVFHVGEHLGTGDAGFLGAVPFQFRITDPEAHVHLPFKFTPWGYSLFRGA